MELALDSPAQTDDRDAELAAGLAALAHPARLKILRHLDASKNLPIPAVS